MDDTAQIGRARGVRRASENCASRRRVRSERLREVQLWMRPSRGRFPARSRSPPSQEESATAPIARYATRYRAESVPPRRSAGATELSKRNPPMNSRLYPIPATAEAPRRTDNECLAVDRRQKSHSSHLCESPEQDGGTKRQSLAKNADDTESHMPRSSEDSLAARR